MTNTRETGTNFYTQQGAAPPPRGGVPTWAVIVAVFVAGNVVAAGLYFSRRSARQRVEPVAAVPAPQPDKGTDEKDALKRAKRVAGLAALEAGDYARAIEDFTAAMKLSSGEAGDLPELLKIARELADQQKARAAKEAKEQADKADDEHEIEEPEEPQDRAPSRTARRRRPAPRPRPAPAPTPVAAPEPAKPDTPKEDEPGLLLVTSTPSGLMVILDGQSKDLTPTRLKVKAGEHQVEIRQGSRVIGSSRITVAPGAVATFDAEAPPEPKPVTVAKVEEPKPQAREEPPAPPKREEPPVVKPEPKRPTERAPDEFGRLEILSPNLHGEVWVDGEKKEGFPPLIVNRVPVGLHRIELRVDGKVLRRKAARVERDQVRTVRF